MQQVDGRSEFIKPHNHMNDLDTTSLQLINTAGSLLNTNRLGLSQELDSSNHVCSNMEQGRSEERQQPMLDQDLKVIGSSSFTNINHEPKSPLGQQLKNQKRKVTLESIRAVEDLVSGRRCSLTKEFEESCQRLRDFIS